MTLDKLPIRVGDHYPDWPAQVDAAAQQESLFCCGIDPSLYAGFADITAFATQTILASKSLGHSINGMVHVRQEFSLHRPIELGAAITGSGIVESIEETDRGQLITTTFEFRTPDDEVPLRTKKASLRVDPSRRPNRTKSNTPCYGAAGASHRCLAARAGKGRAVQPRGRKSHSLRSGGRS